MRNFLPLSIAVLTSTMLGIFSSFRLASAVNFGQQEVDQNKFVAISVPLVGPSPSLVILEQISNSQPCWKESGTNLVAIEALLLKFNFTGICNRSTDSNGYSIRIAGQELGLLYKIKIIKHNSEFVLIGISNTDPNAPRIKIGRTRGIGSGLTKIHLEPAWRFTKRTYNGQTLGHVYLTSDIPVPNNVSQQ